MLLYNSLFVFCIRSHVLRACLCSVVFIGSNLSVSCRCCVLIRCVIGVLVIVLTAMFWSFCSFVMFVVFIVFNGTVGYISDGRTMVL